MSKWRPIALLALVLLSVVLLDHSAVQGYFEDDDLATLTWARRVPLVDLLIDIPALKYPPAHSRPTGYFYFAALHRRFDLTYSPYVIVLQLVGLVNICLLWWLLRRIQLSDITCAVACLFFALSRALFDAWWKPMFVYDVLCTTFALASLLAYIHRRWIVSFLCFWLAVRSKEVGIVVPLLLLWYEMTVGKRNWKRAIPFLLPAAVYGTYGLVYNLRQHSLYTFQFGAAGLWKSLAFYSSKLLWLRYAGLAFLLLPFAVRDRRVWFGTGVLLLGLAIYLVLPGRLFEVYLYLGMTGVAITLAAVVNRWPAVALLILVWAGWQCLLIRKNARATLAAADERRAYVAALRAAPDAPIYIYDRIPSSMHHWGVEGALQLFHPRVTLVHRLEDAGLPAEGEMQLVDWNAAARRLNAFPFSPSSAEYVSGDSPAAAWQLVSGWQRRSDGWLDLGTSAAVARLYCPGNMTNFDCEACLESAGPQPPASLRVEVNGQPVCELHFTQPGCQQQHAQLPPLPAGIQGVRFFPTGSGKLSIRAFGFVSQQSSRAAVPPPGSLTADKPRTAR